MFSHDLEDIFYVLEHRTGIELLVFEAATDIKKYLSDAFRLLLEHPSLENTLPGLIDSKSSIDTVKNRINFITYKC